LRNVSAKQSNASLTLPSSVRVVAFRGMTLADILRVLKSFGEVDGLLIQEPPAANQGDRWVFVLNDG
jgi:hypothetical protein